MGVAEDASGFGIVDEAGGLILDESAGPAATPTPPPAIITGGAAGLEGTVHADLAIAWDGGLMEGDLLFENNDLASDYGLGTAALISLFTDRRALDDDELPDPTSTDKRGWWGDLTSPEVEGDEIGSRLWLLGREKTTPETLTRAEQYAKEALQWMVEDGVATAVKVKAERVPSYDATRLDLSVEIRKVDGGIVAIKFDTQWQSMYA